MIKFFSFISIFFIILNPYTIIGKLGFYSSISILVIYVLKIKRMQVPKLPYINIFLLITLTSFGALSSYINGIGQLNHLVVAISFFITLFSMASLIEIGRMTQIKPDYFLLCILITIVINCIIVTLEVSISSFRAVKESFLIGAGNRDWGEGFRYRGLASSGGAALSMLSPIGILLCFYLYNRRVINFIFLCIATVIILSATLIIGRTGLIMAVLVLLYSVFAGMFQSIYSLFRFLLISILLLLLGALLFPIITEYLSSLFGEGFLKYSFGFLVDGRQGIESEGTLSVLIDFIRVLPLDYPYIITGYGFYGGSEFEPWTDSGFARTFLSIGFPLGAILYINYFLIVKRISGFQPIVVIAVGILCIGELKEPMLYSGYACRAVLIMLLVLKYNDFKKHLKGSRQ